MPRIEDLKNELIKNPSVIKEGGVFKYLPQTSNFTQQEIAFHNQINQDEADIHQLNSLRNKYYHDYFLRYLLKLPSDSIILEVGAGSGHDLLTLIKANKNLIASDISDDSVKFIKSQVEQINSNYQNIIYLVADGQQLPLPNASVDAIYLVAAMHHFEHQSKAIQEFKRILKPNGLLILAMEPSRFMMWFTKLFKNINHLRIHAGHSEADETHNGFYFKDWQSLLTSNFSLLNLKRIWLIQGFVHYSLEALFRIFKLKHRIQLPKWLEYILLGIDEILLKIPVINWLNWHWTVIMKHARCAGATARRES